MITELRQLKMAQYIDVVCEEYGILKAPSKDKECEMRDRLMYEYAEISNPSASAAYLNEKRDEVTDSSTHLFFQICHILIDMGHIEDVRSLLRDYGINPENMTDSQIEADVKSRENRAKALLERRVHAKDELPRDPLTAKEIRKSFDSQAASLMTYYKFQIDLETIPATTFAYMVAQADREIKAKARMYNRLTKK